MHFFADAGGQIKPPRSRPIATVFHSQYGSLLQERPGRGRVECAGPVGQPLRPCHRRDALPRGTFNDGADGGSCGRKATPQNNLSPLGQLFSMTCRAQEMFPRKKIWVN